MPHADMSPAGRVTVSADAHAHPDDRAPVLQDAALTMWVVVGAIAAWSAIVIFFVL